MDETHAGTDTPTNWLKSPGVFGSSRLAMPLLKAEAMLIFVFGIGIRLSSAGQSGRNKGGRKAWERSSNAGFVDISPGVDQPRLRGLLLHSKQTSISIKKRVLALGISLGYFVTNGLARVARL
jgi:hypothetical protein